MALAQFGILTPSSSAGSAEPSACPRPGSHLHPRLGLWPHGDAPSRLPLTSPMLIPDPAELLRAHDRDADRCPRGMIERPGWGLSCTRPVLVAARSTFQTAGRDTLDEVALQGQEEQEARDTEEARRG